MTAAEADVQLNDQDTERQSNSHHLVVIRWIIRSMQMINSVLIICKVSSRDLDTGLHIIMIQLLKQYSDKLLTEEDE